MPDTPVATDPEDWPHYPLWKRVRQAVLAAPDHFETNIHLEGIHATDLHTLNDPLAASIEEIFVATLNKLHHAWDPDLRYERHAFVHQPRTFPNVILRQQQHGAAAPDGHRSEDLASPCPRTGALLPLHRNRGSLQPLGTSSPSCPGVSRTSFPARRSSSGPSSSPPSTAPGSETTTGSTNEQPRRIPESASPPGSRPILPRTDRIADIPRVDSGHNFGCLARHGIMDEYIHTMLQEPVSGIPAERWLQFLQSKGQQ